MWTKQTFFRLYQTRVLHKSFENLLPSEQGNEMSFNGIDHGFNSYLLAQETLADPAITNKKTIVTYEK